MSSLTEASLKPAVILADFGTSYTKWTLLILDSTDSCHLEPAVSESVESERPLSDGGCEWNVSKFIKRMVLAVLEANLKANKLGCVVRGICCTSTTTSIAALRRRNLVHHIPAFRWDDQRATVEAASLESLRRELRVNLWMPFSADSAPARALWLASRFPEDMTGDISLIEQIDLVSFFWTGRRVLSETVASRKWGFTETRPWPADFHAAVADLFGGHLPAMLPRHLVESATPIGRVLPSAAEIYGLSPSTQVIAAPYDTIAQVLGLGLLHEDAAAAVSLGTSMGVFSLTRDLHTVEYSVYGPIPDVPFRDQGLYYDGLRSCASAIDLVCAMALGPKGTGTVYYDRISQCLRETEPGSDGVSVVPYFNGGLRSAIGGVPVIRGFRDTKQKHLVRAVYEAIAYHIRLIIENFEGAMRSPLRRLFTGGGPSKNTEFMQIVADVTGREVRVTKYSDSGLLGCAVCAAVGLKWFESPEEASRALTAETDLFRPRLQHSQTYDDLYTQYRKELPANEDRSEE